MGILKKDARLSKLKKKCKICEKKFYGHTNALYCEKHGKARENIRKKKKGVFMKNTL